MCHVWHDSFIHELQIILPYVGNLALILEKSKYSTSLLMLPYHSCPIRITSFRFKGVMSRKQSSSFTCKMSYLFSHSHWRIMTPVMAPYVHTQGEIENQSFPGLSACRRWPSSHHQHHSDKQGACLLRNKNFRNSRETITNQIENNVNSTDINFCSV